VKNERVLGLASLQQLEQIDPDSVSGLAEKGHVFRLASLELIEEGH